MSLQLQVVVGGLDFHQNRIHVFSSAFDKPNVFLTYAFFGEGVCDGQTAPPPAGRKATPLHGIHIHQHVLVVLLFKFLPSWTVHWCWSQCVLLLPSWIKKREQAPFCE